MNTSAPRWSNKTSDGVYSTYSATQVFLALNLKSFQLPEQVTLLAKDLPPTATMLGGHLAGSLLSIPYNDIDIWCIKGSGSPHDDAVAAVEKVLQGYTKSASKNGTTIFSSDGKHAVMVHRVVFDSINVLLDCIDFTINQIATSDANSFTCGPLTLDDLRTKTLRYAQPPTTRNSPLIKELRDLRLRKYIARGFTPAPSVTEDIRGYSPLLANQLEAQKILDALKRSEDTESSTPALSPVKLSAIKLDAPKPVQPSVAEPPPKVDSRVLDNEFMKQFASSLQSK